MCLGTKVEDYLRYALFRSRLQIVHGQSTGYKVVKAVNCYCSSASTSVMEGFDSSPINNEPSTSNDAPALIIIHEKRDMSQAS